MYRITERLARRVKGVTSDFCVLLLIIPSPPPPSGGLFAIGCGCGKTSLVVEGIRLLGVCAGPDDVFLAQHYRPGLETAYTSAADAAARRSCFAASATGRGRIRTNPDFAGMGDNHPFTMTANPAVLSSK